MTCCRMLRATGAHDIASVKIKTNTAEVASQDLVLRIALAQLLIFADDWKTLEYGAAATAPFDVPNAAAVLANETTCATDRETP